MLLRCLSFPVNQRSHWEEGKMFIAGNMFTVGCVCVIYLLKKKNTYRENEHTQKYSSNEFLFVTRWYLLPGLCYTIWISLFLGCRSFSSLRKCHVTRSRDRCYHSNTLHAAWNQTCISILGLAHNTICSKSSGSCLVFTTFLLTSGVLSLAGYKHPPFQIIFQSQEIQMSKTN